MYSTFPLIIYPGDESPDINDNIIDTNASTSICILGTNINDDEWDIYYYIESGGIGWWVKDDVMVNPPDYWTYYV